MIFLGTRLLFSCLAAFCGNAGTVLLNSSAMKSGGAYLHRGQGLDTTVNYFRFLLYSSLSRASPRRAFSLYIRFRMGTDLYRSISAIDFMSLIFLTGDLLQCTSISQSTLHTSNHNSYT